MPGGASMGIAELVAVFFIVAGVALVVYPASRICARLGYPAILGLVAVVPFANLVLLWFLATAAWPVERTRVGS